MKAYSCVDLQLLATYTVNWKSHGTTAYSECTFRDGADAGVWSSLMSWGEPHQQLMELALLGPSLSTSLPQVQLQTS